MVATRAGTAHHVDVATLAMAAPPVAALTPQHESSLLAFLSAHDFLVADGTGMLQVVQLHERSQPNSTTQQRGRTSNVVAAAQQIEGQGSSAGFGTWVMTDAAEQAAVFTGAAEALSMEEVEANELRKVCSPFSYICGNTACMLCKRCVAPLQRRWWCNVLLSAAMALGMRPAAVYLQSVVMHYLHVGVGGSTQVKNVGQRIRKARRTACKRFAALEAAQCRSG